MSTQYTVVIYGLFFDGLLLLKLRNPKKFHILSAKEISR